MTTRTDDHADPGIVLSDGTPAPLPSTETLQGWRDSYGTWSEHVSSPRPTGHATVITHAEPLHFTPLDKPLSDCTVALVSTGGVHLADQEPFDVFGEDGDWTAREVPGEVDTGDLTVTHTHYATDDALQDINVMFPIDRLRELAAEGVVGSVANRHFGLMGFIPDPAELVSEVVPQIARVLVDHGVDVVSLTGG